MLNEYKYYLERAGLKGQFMTPKYRSDIDGLRAIALLSVLFFHSGNSFFSGGYVGVDVFFVISGYLMASIIINEISNNEFSIIKF